MKTFLGEYGKIIIVTLVAVPILFFLINVGTGSFSSLVKEPVATMGKEDSDHLISDIVSRGKPTIFLNCPVCAAETDGTAACGRCGAVVSARKLKAGDTYHLLNRTEMGLAMKDADGNPISDSGVSIISIKDKEEKEIQVQEDDVLKPSSGIYYIKYKAEEIYRGTVLRTEKEFVFVAE